MCSTKIANGQHWQHCFHPAPAVRLAAAAGLPLAEQRRLLGAVAVRLYDAELRDVTAGLGLGSIVALYYRAPTSYHIH
jgi:hypothetical protein